MLAEVKDDRCSMIFIQLLGSSVILPYYRPHRKAAPRANTIATVLPARMLAAPPVDAAGVPDPVGEAVAVPFDVPLLLVPFEA